MGDLNQDLILNILPFEHPQETITAPFYVEKTHPRMVPLMRGEFPEEAEVEEEVEQLYTNFGDGDDQAISLTIKPEESPKFAKHYYNRLLFNLFKGAANVRKLNFIHNNEFWFRDEEADEDNCRAYKRFGVRTSIGNYTDGPELLVNFKGHSFLYPQPVIDYKGPTTDLNWVVHKGYCFRYEDIPENLHIDHDKMYAVVNRELRQRTGMGFPRRYVSNKVKRYYRQLEWFRKEFLSSSTFKDAIPLQQEEWYKPTDEAVFRVPSEANALVFGEGETEKVPHQGMKDHGPFRPPSQRHIGIFFIVHEDDKKEVANRLANYLKNGKGYFPGLPKYANTPMQFMDEHIVFTDDENPLPEIQAQLQQMSFDERMQYLAIYLSPIHKDEPDPEKRNVYYRVKEELLKYRVSSQVVDRDNVKDENFQYYLPNIAVAVLAKLGGVPWQLEHPPRRELIVGVGAFSPRDKRRKYVGSAFCFSNEGQFRGFQCFAKEETTMLAGSIREAVRNYVAEYGELDRLIIHYYKKMSYKERKPIEDMLGNLGLDDVSVVVVTINKTPSRDILLFDEDWEGKMPVSGTYVRLGHHRLLLCNNTRYPSVEKKPRNFPFPVKVKIESDERGFMHDEENVKEIMQQVYQFSRIYWKSISQQNLPVTIKYPEMVARMFPYFKSRTMPSFGRENLWFL